MMKRVLALLLAAMLCLGACASAEDVWEDMDSLVLNALYTSLGEMMESDASRAVASGAVLLDFVIAETGMELGGGEYFYVMSSGGAAVFICPVQEHETVQSVMLQYNFAAGKYVMRATAVTADQFASDIRETADDFYTVHVNSVSDMAQLLLDAIFGQSAE